VWGGGGLMTLEGVYDKPRALINRWTDLLNRNSKLFQNCGNSWKLFY